jgi:uncharacterized membrane protein YphA (DoxX/SURF4 family)
VNAPRITTYFRVFSGARVPEHGLKNEQSKRQIRPRELRRKETTILVKVESYFSVDLDGSLSISEFDPNLLDPLLWRKHVKIPFLLGRLAFGGFFIYNGINHLRQRKAMAQYAQMKHVPAPEAAVTATGIMLIAGGTSIVFGVKPALGAAAIVAFLAGVSPVMHDFWKAEDPNQRMNDLINFSKNMALMGAALALMGMEEPWPASIPVGQSEKYSSYTEDILAA